MTSSSPTRSIYSTFDHLPLRGKPRPTSEWTILAGFTITTSTSTTSTSTSSTISYPFSHTVVALATGSKCLGRCDKRLDGLRVNDSHAEVLARRALRLRLLREIELHIHAGCLKTNNGKCLLVDYISRSTNSNIQI